MSLSKSEQTIRLGSQKVAIALSGIAIFLVIAHISCQTVKYLTGHATVYGLISLFDMDRENNIPSFFSATILFLGAMITGVIAVFKNKLNDRYKLHWVVLALGFLFLSIDEASSIHELLRRPLSELLGSSMPLVFHFMWVIPAIVAVALLSIFYLPFLLHLPFRTRMLVIVSAALFLGGAIGMELLGGRYVALHSHLEFHGRNTLPWIMLTTLEELLEMAGGILFMFSMLDYLKENSRDVCFRVH